MSWRFRKIINFCYGFRATISCGGAGFSWGFPGFRIGKGATEGIWISIGIPGTGFYVTKRIKNILKPMRSVPEIDESSTATSSSTQKRHSKITEWNELK